MNAKMASIGSPSPTNGSDLDRKSSFCSKFRCCCSTCFGAKTKSGENSGNGNNGNSETGNGIKLQRRVLRNDACSTTIEQVFETDPNFGNRPDHSNLVRSCSQEFLDYRSHQQHQLPCTKTTTAAVASSTSVTTTQFQQPRSIHMHQYAFPSSPKSLGSPAICSNVGVRPHSHKRRHPQSTQDVAVGKDADNSADSKPEASWAKLELLASTTSLTGKQQAAAESRNDRLLSRYERIDKIAMWLFPIVFFLFNICYWSYYLLLDDVLQDLW